MVKSHLPMQEMKEMWVQSLCEDPLENGVETHSSDLAWRTPGTEEPGGLQSLGSQRVAHASVCAEWLSTHTGTMCV